MISMTNDTHTICPHCNAQDSIVSVEESITHYRVYVTDGWIEYDGTSEKMIQSEIVDYQCVECGQSFSGEAVKNMEVKQ